MRLLYHILIRFYGILIALASFFSAKAKQWINGRRQWHKRLPNGREQSIIWFHCASLGEYQQAKPLIARLKNSHQKYKVLLTFFSPSGYLNAGENKNVDFMHYLPLDTLSNTRQFVEKVNPVCAIFIQSELWPNFLDSLQQKSVPTLVASARFKANSHLFKFYGQWHLKLLKGVHRFFVQDEESKKRLNRHGIEKVSVSGDSRYDKVIENRQNAQALPLIELFKGSQALIVAGSTYKTDSQMLVRISQKMPEVKFIIAPHHVDYAQELQKDGLLYSQAHVDNIQDSNLLIIDNIGMLDQLYQYAKVAYVGGAFGGGLHNILEALVFDSPVVFGPHHQQFKEAQEAMNEGIAISVSTESELEEALSFYLNAKPENGALAFCKERKGANDLILEGITGCL